MRSDTHTKLIIPISSLVPQIPAATGSFTVGEAKAWFSLLYVLILFKVGAQAPANTTGEFTCTPRMESMMDVESFSKTHSYCKKNKITFFSWPHLDVDVVSPGFCPSAAWNKTICPMRPCLNSRYRKYDSKHFKTQLFSFLWHALGLCWINCWQSQGPDTNLEVGFLAFFFPFLFLLFQSPTSIWAANQSRCDYLSCHWDRSGIVNR